MIIVRRIVGSSAPALLLLLAAACSSSPPSGDSTGDGGGGGSTKRDAGKQDASLPSGSGSSDGDGDGDDDRASDASSMDADVPDAGDGSNEAGGREDDGGTLDAAPPCVKGQVRPSQVVMIGDSYLDPNWANTAVDLFATAQDAGALPPNTTWRHYYVGGASMAWGNPGTPFYIPYQYDPQAKTDLAVTDPKDIKIIIMDGGGNDVLIGNGSCLTTPPPGNASCTKTVQDAVDKARSTMSTLARDGVQTVLYFFYPHLDADGGGILPVPAPGVNKTLDYAYPMAEQVCCGADFTATADRPYCVGQPVAGSALTCVFLDSRPLFEGHASEWIKDDHVHPNPTGAQHLSDLIWRTMQEQCIAQ